MNTRLPYLRKLVVLVFGICGFSIFAEQQEFTIEPAPDWAAAVEIKEYDNPLEKEASSGVFCLLWDVEINGGTKERFVHMADKYVTEAGVETGSRLSVSFDPSYQQLVFHKIAIHRGSQILDQLDPGKIRVIQQEKDLDRLIYNGTKTAILFLEDIQVGDWVEYAYTIRGRNPVEHGHFYDSLQLRWPFPIQSENYRCLWPVTNQPLWVQPCARDIPENRKITGPYYEYYWQWENRAGQETEDFTAPPTMQDATVHFSDFSTWKEVADWADKSFEPQAISQELYKKAIALRDANSSDAQRVAAALQFVQDDIRYLGIENGVNSHLATDPSIVFSRGYGDCKDKALLFCTILRFFDVDAVPVLVSTGLHHGIKSFRPTPLFFDHVVVRVIAGGETNYFDTTRSLQRGPLNGRYIDRFGAGLPLGEDSTGLVDIAPSIWATPHTIVDEYFKVLTNGATYLAMTNTLEGGDADFMRKELALLSRDALEKNLLASYRKFYPGIVKKNNVEIEDDADADRIQITGHYYISNIWVAAAQTNYITCMFPCDGVVSRLIVPAKRVRRWPLLVPAPEDFIHRVQIETGEKWRVTPSEKNLQTKAFQYSQEVSCPADNRVTILNNLSVFGDTIAAADMPEYMADLQQIQNSAVFSITKPTVENDQDSSINWSVWIGAISYSVVMVIAAVMVYRLRHRSPLEIDPNADLKLKGIRGWLILVAIGLIGGVSIHVFQLLKFGHVYSTHSWRALSDPANVNYNAILIPLLLYELCLKLTLLIFGILLLVLFFQKKRIFPTVFVTCLVAQFLAITLDEVIIQTHKSNGVVMNDHSNPTTPILQSFVALLVWGLYFQRSKRAKLTFVN